MPHAVPRYSPVGSKASVHPNSGDSSRMVPPRVGAPLALPDEEAPLLLLHATATRANVTPNAAAASRLRPITSFTPFSLSPQTSSARVYGIGPLRGFALHPALPR